MKLFIFILIIEMIIQRYSINTMAVIKNNNVENTILKKDKYIEELLNKFYQSKYFIPDEGQITNLDKRMLIRINYDMRRKFKGSLTRSYKHIIVTAEDNQSFMVVNKNNMVELYNLKYMILYLDNVSNFPFPHPYELIIVGMTSTAAVVEDYNYLVISIPIVFSEIIDENEEYIDNVLEYMLGCEEKLISFSIDKIFAKVENSKFINFDINEESEYNSALDKHYNFFLYKIPLKVRSSKLKLFEENAKNLETELKISNEKLFSENFFFKTKRKLVHIEAENIYRNYELEKVNYLF